VMYASKLVELTGVSELFASPFHPYTHGLFRSLPRLGQATERLDTIPGAVPNPLRFPGGCKFHTRCELTKSLAEQAGAGETVRAQSESGTERVLRRCACQEPPLREIRPGHWCSCWEAEGYCQAEQTDPSGYLG